MQKIKLQNIVILLFVFTIVSHKCRRSVASLYVAKIKFFGFSIASFLGDATVWRYFCDRIVNVLEDYVNAGGGLS